MKRRHVLAEGYVGEWNLADGASAYRIRKLESTILTGSIFPRPMSIAGARRRKGLRARRVRVILEEL